ncbi:hypothetical protein MTR67_022960, partial [Solanum verrucosum]
SNRQGIIVNNSSSQESSSAKRIRVFLRMNPLMFIGSKVEEDPMTFINETWKILKEIHAIQTEGVELFSYQLKDVVHIWYEHWEESRDEDADVWDEFEEAFLNHFFPQELREAKEDEDDLDRRSKMKKCL